MPAGRQITSLADLTSSSEVLCMKRFIAPVLAVAAAARLGRRPGLRRYEDRRSKDNVFVPKTMTVKKNTTVKWVWKGKAPHNVTVRAAR